MNNLKVHPFLFSCQSIAEICKPLFECTGIKTFDWIRTYNDGSRARLTTHPQWVEHYLTQKYYQNSQLERHPSLYRTGFTIWDYQIHRETKEVSSILKDMRENFDRAHGLSILKVYPNYMDNFTFTTSALQEDINSSYFYYLEAIERFLIYFMSKATKFISEAEKQKVFLDINKQDFFSLDGSILQIDPKIETFIELTPIERAYINVSDSSTLLGKRETQCLISSLKGKSSKEIAKYLNISHRSVETYLENIKNKLNFFSRAHMFEQVLNSESILLLMKENSLK